jgi:tRNA(Leu) C34 or U34 (ribose-2'-O)-methylase TrmL
VINPSNQVSIGLTNPKSPSNVGAVMRAAGCYQVDAVYYTGQRYARAAKFNTDTKQVTDRMPLSALDSFKSVNEMPFASKASIVCIELVEGAQPLPDFVHPDNAFYIFGPEDGSISQEVIDEAAAVVYIPTVGCMNLAATVNVVLYDRLAKSVNQSGSDELIKLSRDTNNRLKLT